MAFPSPVKTYHSNTYAAINPEQAHLSTRDKNVVITGGGSGIGAAIAGAFARSGSSSITLLGRTEKTLKETKAKIERETPGSLVVYYVADIVDRKSLDAAFSDLSEKFGKIDILVANAAYLPDPASIGDSHLEEWYNGFNVNVKGSYNLFQAFLPCSKQDARIIHLSTGVVHLPYAPASSAYHTSKLAATKFFDYVHHEYPNFFVLNVHPGVFETAMGLKAEVAKHFPLDDLQLPADYAVWAASPEANFLNGKFVWAHWDVDELRAIAEELKTTPKFTLGLLGWP